MRSIVLATIPHTGTMFVLGLLQRMGYAVRPAEESAGSEPAMVFFAHTQPKYMPAIERLVERVPLVTTTRDLVGLSESWRRRGESGLAEAVSCWLSLPSPGVVDVFRRDLSALAEAIGQPVIVDSWEPVNAYR